MDIIIANSTCTDMVQWASTMTTHAMMLAIQKKTQSYIEWITSNDFIPLLLKHMGIRRNS
jgi:hypothetical protein